MTPEHIRTLAREALDPPLAIDDLPMWPPAKSPSLAREVIADWCEEAGYSTYALYLRPRPVGRGVDPETWTGLRRAILRWLAGDLPGVDRELSAAFLSPQRQAEQRSTSREGGT